MKHIILIFLFCVTLTFGQSLQKDSTSQDNWSHADLESDSIPGISLDKAYQTLLKDKKGTSIIAAVIDTDIDLDHEDLREQIWINTDEIHNNGIDDDKNGYIDDIHGWNFIRNTQGQGLPYCHYSETRIIRKYRSYFENKDSLSVPSDQRTLLHTYKQALTSHTQMLHNAKAYIKKYKRFKNIRNNSLKEVISYLGDSIITLDKLEAIKTEDSTLLKHISNTRKTIERNADEAYFDTRIQKKHNLITISLNLDANPRTIIGDNPEDIEDTAYGSPVFDALTGNLDHATAMSGLIAATRNNDIGINGISNHIKIMPLCNTGKGDYTDKDMALAIRYATDNGAKVINISQGKKFSMQEEWFIEALRYAEINDVLVVISAGNDNVDIDKVVRFPRDNNDDNEDITNNTIFIGASSNTLDKNLKVSFSNYGKANVDAFAPGYKLQSLESDNTYRKASGTSHAAAITSGVAALVRSYYPNLSASQVKTILMESGTSYDIDVEIKQEDGTKKMVPFAELSKSGKIINAYNALLMAEEMSIRTPNN